MLSGNDSLRTDNQLVSSVSSGVFTHLSSVRRLSIYHGRLFRELFFKGFSYCVTTYVSLLRFCGKLSYDVVNKFTDLADGKPSWRSKAAYVASVVATCFIGFIILAECLIAMGQALLYVSFAVLGLFLAHNIVHTTILGVTSLSREVEKLWKAIFSDPMQNIKAGANAFERSFETALYRISQFALALICIAPSVLTAAFSVALNPLYMLLNVVFPKLDLEETRVTKKTLLEMAQNMKERVDATISEVAHNTSSMPELLFKSSPAEFDSIFIAVNEVVSIADKISFQLSNSARVAEAEFKEKMVDQHLSTDPEVVAALASITNCKNNVETCKSVGVAMLAKMEEADRTQPASTERKTAIKILKLLESSTNPVDSFSNIESFTLDASLTLCSEEQEKAASPLDKVKTSITGISAERIQGYGCMSLAG